MVTIYTANSGCELQFEEEVCTESVINVLCERVQSHKGIPTAIRCVTLHRVVWHADLILAAER